MLEKCRKLKLCSPILAFMVIFSVQAVAQASNFRMTGSGDSHLSIKTKINGQKERLYEAKISMSVTELKSLGIAIVYNPRVAVLPFAPTALRAYELGFSSDTQTQNELCQLIGYSNAIIEESQKKAYIYNSKDHLAFIDSKYKEVPLREKHVSFRDVEPSPKELTRLVCQE